MGIIIVIIYCKNYTIDGRADEQTNGYRRRTDRQMESCILASILYNFWVIKISITPFLRYRRKRFLRYFSKAFFFPYRTALLSGSYTVCWYIGYLLVLWGHFWIFSWAFIKKKSLIPKNWDYSYLTCKTCIFLAW